MINSLHVYKHEHAYIHSNLSQSKKTGIRKEVLTSYSDPLPSIYKLLYIQGEDNIDLSIILIEIFYNNILS